MGHHSTLWCIAGLAVAALAIWDIESSLQSGQAKWFGAPFDRVTSAGEFWFVIAYRALAVLGGFMLAALAFFS
jgi:hypothetical protein